MNTVREYRMPLLIGAGGLVVAVLLWAILISPQNSKLSSLQAQQTQLQTQQTNLQVKLDALKSEKQQLSGRCADLQKIATQIPTVQSPTDIAAEESTFESQFNGLASTSGVNLVAFSGFIPASTTAGTPAATTPAAATPAVGTTTEDVTAVPTTLTVTGNYGQMVSFINGLDTFPRLFVIQRFVLAYGTLAASTATSSSSSSSAANSSSAATGSAGAPALWVGGTPTSPSAGPYSVAITGSIYYSSTPNALDACTKATAAASATTAATK
jgi:Tfp pilus assembly protein PilO